MYVVFQNGNKQYRINKNKTIFVEKLKNIPGKIVEFDNVLILSDNKKIYIGNPFLKNTKIKCEIIRHKRGKKIRIIKFKRRKHSLKKMGHRQWYTEIKMNSVNIK